MRAATVAEVLRINAVAKVVNADIRHINHNGRPHIVVPSYTLPDDVVMNEGLYPADEIRKSFKSLEGTLAPIGHPTVNGVFVKAGDAEAINAHYVGVWNKNVKQVDGRVYIEKWIDVEFAEKFEQGRQLLEAIENGDPLHTSTGLLCKRELAVNQAYKWIATEMRFDHDAILFDEPGAATPADGVGMMVNKAELVVNAICPQLTTNGVLSDSYGQRRDALYASLREMFATSENYVHVEDFDATTVIYGDSTGLKSVGYEMAEGNAIIKGVSMPVSAKVEFVAVGGEIGTRFALNKNEVQCNPAPDNKPTDSPENAKMDETQAKAIAEMVTNAVTAAVSPLQTLVQAQATTIASLQSSLTVNADKADKANRDIILAKAPGMAVVVNALSGDLLATMAAQYQDAASLATGTLETNAAKADLDAFNKYEGQ